MTFAAVKTYASINFRHIGVSVPRTRKRYVLFILISIVVLCLIFSIIKAIHVQDRVSASNSWTYSAEMDKSSRNSQQSTIDFDACLALRRPLIHIGIMSMANQVKSVRRHLIRNMYNLMLDEPVSLSFQNQSITQLRVRDFVRISYVMGSPKDTDELSRVQFEALTEKDLIILDIPENMNDGKTYEYFKHVAKTMDSPQHPVCQIYDNKLLETLPDTLNLNGFDFVAKGDDDTFIHLPNLVKYLLKLRRQVDTHKVLPNVYLGRYWKYADPLPMAGMLYALSWDLNAWVGSSDIPAKHAIGDEDKQVAVWFKEGKLRVTDINDEKVWVDHPSTKAWNSEWAVDSLTDDLVAIHQCKQDTVMIDTAQHYFLNSTLKI